MANFSFDGHKLFYQFETTYNLLTDRKVDPIYIEYSPVGSCNHRCIFCAYDYIGYQPRKLDTINTITSIKDFAKLGVKAMLFAGEGEPLLHPDIDRFISTCYENQIDSGIYTNGALLDEKRIKNILDKLTFIRISFNAGNKETYKKVHQIDTFDKVVKNIKYAVKFKKENNLEVDIGMQIVLIPENIDSLVDLAKLGKELGVDYLAVKPYVKHLAKETYKMEEDLKLKDVEELFKKAESFSNDNYKVVVRRDSFKRASERTYDHCLALPLFAWILSDGNIYACNHFLYDERFYYGNLNEKSVIDMFNSPKRDKILKFAKEKLDCKKECMPNCRLDAINRSLWELKHPTVKHVNFI